MASSLVLVYDFLVGDAVDHRNGFLIDALGSRFVAGDDRLLHALDGRAQGGAQGDMAAQSFYEIGNYTYICECIITQNCLKKEM